uniref:Uncharacterized protein n=1 Tax=Panagrolaimus sp. PS1159 TaxID=55785 RepID=A0AC35FXA3_9BILA
MLIAVVNARIICPRNGDDERLQQRSLCRQRFVELKNTPAYRSMLQAIADRRLPLLSGSIASFQQQPSFNAISSSPSFSSSSSSSKQNIDEEVNSRPLTTYQDIMHNLLMKMP